MTEEARVRALLDEQILNTAPERPFDDLALVASAAFETPIAVVCFMLPGGPWFKAVVGLTEAELVGGADLCRFVLTHGQALVIPDLLADQAWADTSRRLHGVRFYAGVPMTTQTGHAVGTLCVGDYRPRTLSARQRLALDALARQAMSQLELRNARTTALERAVAELRAEVRERQAVEEALYRSQEQLVQSQKLQAVGQLAGGVAHEFNNILTVIFGNLSVLETEFDAHDPRRGDVRRVAESADRAALLIRQLLAFSRHQRLTPEVDDLNRLIARQERALMRLVGNAVQVTLALSADPCRVRVDPAHVEQVIVNLALNARDAMPQGGTLRIETMRLVVEPGATVDWGHVEPGPYAAMRVSDDGHGMSPEVQRRAFEPFFTTKDVGKGTGLGLSTVYGIIAQNGGHIRVASEPGVGTTFTILLPLISPAAIADAATSPRTPRGSETILLVDDELSLRDLAASVLRRQGYWVLEASSGFEALGIAAREPGPIHLLLTDVVMPGMTGAGLARRWLTTRPGTSVLFMSGFTDDPESLGLGPESDFIAKPFTPSALLGRVRALLDRGSGRETPATGGPSAS